LAFFKFNVILSEAKNLSMLKINITLEKNEAKLGEILRRFSRFASFAPQNDNHELKNLTDPT